MNRLLSTAFSLTALVICFCSCSQRRAGALTGQEIASFRSIPVDTALQKRLSGEDFLMAALDSSCADALDTACTYFVHSRGITNQGNSGRCWYFSVMNILRQRMISDYDLDGFEFSECYAQFWDLLEKSNHFLEEVIAARDEKLSSQTNEWLFRKPVGDGGHFLNAAYLTDKYGLVPYEVMPDTYAAANNLHLMSELRTLLRRGGLHLRECRPAETDSIKRQILEDVWKLLCLNLGTPPSQFQYSLCDRKGDSVSTGTYTPLSFRDTFVKTNLLADYAVIMNDSSRPYHRMYTVRESRNSYEYPDWTFLNLPVEEIEALGVASLRGGDMFYFTCDTYKDALQDQGIYDTGLYPVDSLLGIRSAMSKDELILSGEITSAHALAMTGVRLSSSGKPISWVVENSFGYERGFGGYCVMSAHWFERYMLRMAVPRKYLSPEQQRCLSMRPKPIPAWNLSY